MNDVLQYNHGFCTTLADDVPVYSAIPNLPFHYFQAVIDFYGITRGDGEKANRWADSFNLRMNENKQLETTKEFIKHYKRVDVLTPKFMAVRINKDKGNCEWVHVAEYLKANERNKARFVKALTNQVIYPTHCFRVRMQETWSSGNRKN